MSRPAPEDVRTVTCIGAGVIGGGWVAYFLARGYRVVAWDPAEDAETRLRHLVTAAWPALTELGLAEGASLDNLTVEADLASACAQADFVQESAPEDLELKRKLLADISAATPEDVVISSSTSGYGMSEMATQAEHADRLVVGHPFNPPYLIPLVEVVGGTEHLPGGRGVDRRRSSRTPASRSSRWSARCPASSPTGSRRRCGARPCTWSRPGRRRSRRSTCPSPTARACAGPCRVRC